MVGVTLVGCLLPVGVIRAAARSGEGITLACWTDWTDCTGWRGCGLVKLVWNRDWGLELVVVGGGGDLGLPTLCLCLCLAGLVGLVVSGEVGEVLSLPLLPPSLTSPPAPGCVCSLSRLNISRRRGCCGCLRGCSVRMMTGAVVVVVVVVEGEVGENVGLKGVVGVVEGSVGTILSEIVGRNTEDVSASKLPSSSCEL